MTQAAAINTIVGNIAALTDVVAAQSTSIAALTRQLAAVYVNLSSTEVTDKNLASNTVASESSARIVSDNVLSTAIGSEASAGVAGDLVISVSVTSEIAARINGDNTLSSSVVTTSSLAIAADTSIQTNLLGEISARIAGDGVLAAAVINLTVADIKLASSLANLSSITVPLGSLTFPGADCSDIFKRSASPITDGFFYITGGAASPYRVYCKVLAGTAFTMVMNFDTSDGNTMWWGNNLWQDANTYGTLTTAWNTDVKSPAFNPLTGNQPRIRDSPSLATPAAP